MWRKPSTCYHQENTIERHRYGGAGWLVWGGIIPGSRADLHVQSVTMTASSIWMALLDEWCNISQDQIDNLILGKPRRSRATVRNFEHGVTWTKITTGGRSRQKRALAYHPEQATVQRGTERTERPIRRLSKVMYGSTCADMQEQLSGGSVVVVHEEPHPQMTGTLSYRPEETCGRQRDKSLDTRNRRLDDRYRILPWPEDCTVVVCLHDALYGVYL
ncbi:HTH_Tnp_Tc3_2 domain-containing protein [Trichonephila clavipes]|nr:HTH_Tnp_Tc3_2 domain-containing protein [Trichonephila clavipes]